MFGDHLDSKLRVELGRGHDDEDAQIEILALLHQAYRSGDDIVAMLARPRATKGAVREVHARARRIA